MKNLPFQKRGDVPDGLGNLSKQNKNLKSSLFSPNFQVETCVSWSDSPSQQIDLAFNIFFLIYFFIRVSLHCKNFFKTKIRIRYGLIFSLLRRAIRFGSYWKSTVLWITSLSHQVLWQYILREIGLVIFLYTI